MVGGLSLGPWAHVYVASVPGGMRWGKPNPCEGGAGKQATKHSILARQVLQHHVATFPRGPTHEPSHKWLMQVLLSALKFNVRFRTTKRTMHSSGHLPRQERPHAPPQDNDAPAILGKTKHGHLSIILSFIVRSSPLPQKCGPLGRDGLRILSPSEWENEFGQPACKQAILRRAAAISLFHLPIIHSARSTEFQREPWNMQALGLERACGLPEEVGRFLVLAPQWGPFSLGLPAAQVRAALALQKSVLEFTNDVCKFYKRLRFCNVVGFLPLQASRPPLQSLYKSLL